MISDTMEADSDRARHVLVVGAYGLIGAGVVRALVARGHRVTGLGRDPATARRVLPGIDWVIRDLRAMGTAADWRPLLDGVDVVVNAAGALQDGAGDDVAAVQERAVVALAEACAESGAALAQISAVGADPASPLDFLSTKGRADAAIAASRARHWILRPGLVIADSAYGGTALIRMLAAMPVAQPVAMPGAEAQCVGLADVSRAVALAVEDALPDGLACDLVEDAPQRLTGIVDAHRRWLGLGPARIIPVPGWVLRPTAALADLLGRLGWRSPLRTTAIRALAAGILGDPGPWRAATGEGVAPLEDTLARLTAGTEHRLAARMALIFPVAVAILVAFWLASGVIGLVRADDAAAVLTDAGWPGPLARASVIFWALVDIALAAGLMVRRTARAALWGMIGVSLVYLISATIVTPWLWLDPLGPLVKVLPGIVLAAAVRAMMDTR